MPNARRIVGCSFHAARAIADVVGTRLSLSSAEATATLRSLAQVLLVDLGRLRWVSGDARCCGEAPVLTWLSSMWPVTRCA